MYSLGLHSFCSLNPTLRNCQQNSIYTAASFWGTLHGPVIHIPPPPTCVTRSFASLAGMFWNTPEFSLYQSQRIKGLRFSSFLKYSCPLRRSYRCTLCDRWSRKLICLLSHRCQGNIGDLGRFRVVTDRRCNGKLVCL